MSTRHIIDLILWSKAILPVQIKWLPITCIVKILKIFGLNSMVSNFEGFYIIIVLKIMVPYSGNFSRGLFFIDS